MPKEKKTRISLPIHKKKENISISPYIEDLRNENDMYNTLNNPRKLYACKRLMERLRRMKFIYNEASQHFGKRNLQLVIPAVIMSGLSSIIAFLATSDIFDDTVKIGLTLTVGIITGLATILQSVSGSLNYNTKHDMFKKASNEYDKLIIKVKFELYNPNEVNFLDDIEKEILTIQNNCKFLPPNWMNERWNKHKINKIIKSDELYKKYGIERYDSDYSGLFGNSNNKYKKGTFIISPTLNNDNINTNDTNIPENIINNSDNINERDDVKLKIDDIVMDETSTDDRENDLNVNNITSKFI